MKVSIIVPARNEGRYIGACLESLRKLDHPEPELEIVVIDNGSTDDTRQVAEQAGIPVLQHLGGRVGGVRNRGVRETNSEIVAFIDADCVAPERWLASALDVLKDPTVGAAGGHYLPNPQGTWVERVWASSQAPESESETPSLPGGSIILRRSVFERVGGFDSTLSAGEDDDLCRKIQDLDLKVVAVPESYVIHLGFPSTLKDVVRRQLWHGSSQLDVATSIRDGQLVLTHSFLLGGLAVVTGALFAQPLAVGIATGLLSAPVITLAIRKSVGRPQPILSFLRLIPISFAYYLGRSGGLFQNYARRIRRSKERLPTSERG